MTRKGARSRDDLDPAVLAELNAGTAETLTLPEGLAMDFAVLMSAIRPGLDVAPLRAAAGEGITRRMALAAKLLLEAEGGAVWWIWPGIAPTRCAAGRPMRWGCCPI